VDDAERVRLSQRAADLRGDAGDAVLGHGPDLAQRLVERLAFQILHRHVVDVVVGLAVVEDGHRVRVRDLRRDACLAEEAAVKLRIGVAVVVRVQHLDGAEAPERRLLGPVDLAHAAARDERRDPEALRDDATEQGVRCP
jgi:hypothetical protein